MKQHVSSLMEIPIIEPLLQPMKTLSVAQQGTGGGGDDVYYDHVLWPTRSPEGLTKGGDFFQCACHLLEIEILTSSKRLVDPDLICQSQAAPQCVGAAEVGNILPEKDEFAYRSKSPSQVIVGLPYQHPSLSKNIPSETQLPNNANY
jgi:hypothetical protein